MRTVLTAAVLMVSALTASAQQANVIATIPEQNLQGTFTSPSAVIPANTRELYIVATMTDAVASDPSKTGRLVLEISDDDGTTWKVLARATYRCGTQDPETGLWRRPSVGVGADDPSFLSGKRIRGILDIPERTRLGAEIHVF